MDKENATLDLAIMGDRRGAREGKRSRSKSLGPGGLIALQETTGNSVRVKSILKSTPFSPQKTGRRESMPATNHDMPPFQSPKQHVTSPRKASPSTGIPKSPSGEAAQKAEERKARRKSMLSRRVSFAPEATLHTWNVVEMPDDSTTSTSPNSTRRNSAVTMSSEPPSTPDVQIAASPAQESGQRKRRRSSHNGPVEMSSSPYGDDDGDIQTIDAVDESSSGSDSDHDLVEEETINALDQEEATLQSAGESTGSSARLEGALQQAARQAGTRGIDFDEHGDMTMEMADDEVTNAFQPWANPHSHLTDPFGPADDQTMEMTAPLGGVIGDTMDLTRPTGRIVQSNDADDRTMDMTRPVGGIVQQPVEVMDDQTMDMTRPVGGIVQQPMELTDDQTMEMTKPLGGIVLAPPPALHRRRQSLAISPIKARTTEPTPTEEISTMEDETMDLTTAMGSIQPLNQADDNEDLTMELTTVVGGLPSTNTSAKGTPQRPMGAGLMDERPLPARATPQKGTVFDQQSPHRAQVSKGAGIFDERPIIQSPQKLKGVGVFDERPLHSSPRKPNSASTVASPTRSPIHQAQNPTTPSSARRQAHQSPSDSANRKAQKPVMSESTKRQLSERPTSATPATPKSTKKQVIETPRLPLATPGSMERQSIESPYQTPKVAPVEHISQSPGGVQAANTTPRANANARAHTERTTVTPLSSTKNSPKSSTQQYTPKKSAQSAHDEVQSFPPEEDRDLESSKENMVSGHSKPTTGSPHASALLKKRLSIGDSAAPFKAGGSVRFDEDPSLKEKIEGMTPQKKKLKGRKSLHVGAARGILGKRPIELDQNETDSTSPLKKVKLPAPPTQIDTTGIARPAAPDASGERVQLQDFLNMTGIRFMELTTTKRRPTMAIPGSTRKPRSEPEGQETMEDRVVAGACTVPMLELYQHSCRELKNYISEGRRVAKEIEEAVYEENPILFRQYLDGSTEVKNTLEAQFKNGKTNARLLSKAMWYEWRMKLLDGLRGGLKDIQRGMDADEILLKQQGQLLHPVLPALEELSTQLEKELEQEQARAAELEVCDPNELASAREELQDINIALEARQQNIDRMQEEAAKQENALETVVERKEQCSKDVLEARNTQQSRRGWQVTEVQALQDKVARLEQDSGWQIVSADEMATMSYKDTLRLQFDPRAFLPHKDGQAAISLNLLKEDDLTTERRFFLQVIRARLHALPQGQTQISELLSFISESWQAAETVVQQIETLRLEYMTESGIVGDESMAVQTTILLKTTKTKVHVSFAVGVHLSESTSGMRVLIRPTAAVIYGETLNEARMGEFLDGRLKGGRTVDTWVQGITELEARLRARGRK